MKSSPDELARIPEHVLRAVYFVRRVAAPVGSPAARRHTSRFHAGARHLAVSIRFAVSGPQSAGSPPRSSAHTAVVDLVALGSMAEVDGADEGPITAPLFAALRDA